MAYYGKHKKGLSKQERLALLKTNAQSIAQRIDYEPRDMSLFMKACAHSSIRPYGAHFERLEFLGDRVLSASLAQQAILLYPQASQGELSERLFALVDRYCLCRMAYTWGLDTHLMRLKDPNTQQPEIKLMCDGVEAIIGVIALDSGFAVADTFIKRHWQDALHTTTKDPYDARSALRDLCLKKKWSTPEYTFIHTQGADHQKKFTVRVHIPSTHHTQDSTHSSKKEASKKAAHQLYTTLLASQKTSQKLS